MYHKLVKTRNQADPDSPSFAPNIGITSRMIKEISNGPILANEVQLIELNMDNREIFISNEINFEFLDKLNSLGNMYSIHGPYDTYPNDNKNLEVIEKVFSIADYIHAKYIVIHTATINQDYRDALLKAVSDLKRYCKIAAKHSIILLIENMVREKKYDRIGVLPSEILQVIQLVNEENLKFCFDVGHGNLSANQYGFDIVDFVTVLRPYLCHMHIHDNTGVPPTVNDSLGDQHLSLGRGKIDYEGIFSALNESKVENLVLELLPTNTTRAQALDSITTLRELVSRNRLIK